MPLDGHQYLVAQGWSGKGTGLRAGAITRPIAVSQKKTLAGLGKDRDEAFPFWDHLFSAASKSIQVKISNDSDDSDADQEDDTAAPVLKRTTTGILSNRRPTSVTPATTSGTSTPATPQTDGPRLSLIALAKREAAKRNLYSRFYRGPVLGPDIPEEQVSSPQSTSRSSTELPVQKVNTDNITSKEKNEDKEKADRRLKKKRKAEELEKEERRERKRRKKELKQLEKLERRAKKRAKKCSSAAEEEVTDCVDKAERCKRKEEKRRRREGKVTCSAQAIDVVAGHTSKDRREADLKDTELDTYTKSSSRQPKTDVPLEGECAFPKAKKKRRASE